MLAPISWLKDYVDINVSPEQLAKKLVGIGFEVEQIIYQNKKANGVVVGKIIEVDKHPNADRLRVTKIDVGSRVIQVVTNVPVTGGETIAVALDGAALADGHVIKSGDLRGVVSEGMLCGPEEVGLTAAEADGQKEGDILRFDEGTALGMNALDALGYDDVILDIGITANRPDCNGIFKLAKEVAVALGTECREPHIGYKTAGGSINDVVAVEVKNHDLCPRYMAAAVGNIRIAQSSPLIKKRLRAVGIRPINNIVDITNYVLTEIGQPMHSFDRRELEGNKIVVRNAEDGEKIVTLDGKTNMLNDSMLVICDAYKPVAVAGIMGGENSGIKQDTAQVVFESAKFARDNVRRTSRALNLRSDSSARFEKGIDFASQELGLKRALTLVYESGCGDIVDGIIDIAVDYIKERDIAFTLKQLRDILGCNVPKARLIDILNKLGITVNEKDGKLHAIIKEDREDIVGVNDIAEEFIRVYGYRHVKPTLFEYAALTEGGVPDSIKAVDKIKDVLCACGLREAVTYSFTTPKFADKLKLGADDARRALIRLVNPIGEALSVMRTTLTHSMLETLAYNVTHFVNSAALFEVARVYTPHALPLTELPDEREKVVIGEYGEDVDYYSVKGAVENLLSALNVTDVKYVRTSEPFLHPGRGADIYVDGDKAGYIGEVHPDVAAGYGVDNFRLYIAELYVDGIAKYALERHTFAPFTRFPVVERDLAVVVDEAVFASDMTDAAANAKAADLVGFKIFDTYRGEQIGKGKKSVAIRFYFANITRTLTDAEINGQMDKILSALKRKVGAKIR